MDAFMVRGRRYLNSSQRAGFTLIEILVTIGIIVLLATVLLAVGSGVRKKSQVTATRTELKALEGIVAQFEQDNPSTFLPTTLYANNGQGAVTPYPAGTAIPAVNFVDILYRYPTTQTQLVNLVGSKLRLAPGTGRASTSAILDYFGNPINFIPQGTQPGGWPASSVVPRDYLLSSGPDGRTDWGIQTDAVNSDDIISYEAAR